VSHASGAGLSGAPASERAGESGPPPPLSGFGEVSPEPASTMARAKADGAEPPGLNDAHCHFFSSSFFATLGRDVKDAPSDPASELPRRLGWEPPGDDEALADRWVAELDRHGVARAALIASVPGDEASVAAAVRRHPSRFVGFFMVNAAAPDATERAERAFGELGLRAACLFPAMHHYRLDDERVGRIASAAADHKAAVFVHCGVLSVGVRKKLALPSRFDLRLGDPLAVAALALRFPAVPFIIPHFGAGMFREALMATDTAENVHLDTSSSNGWRRYQPGLSLDDVFRQVVSVAGARRVLFGTDSSFFPRGWQRAVYDEQTAVLESLELDEPTRAMMLGGNFDRLFPR
jgi:predicted TIM-barrel fold metal-dependent hydrolase